jgi:sugar lactone lactonase YvrE
MKRRNVYIGMVLIALTTAAVFTFIFLNSSKAVKDGLLDVIDTSGAPSFSHQLTGDFNITLNKPMDATVANSFTYVTDTNNKRVVVFDTGGQLIFQFGEDGTKEGQFKFPYGISADSKGQVYVADLYNGKISIHDAKGKFISYFAKELTDNKTISSPAGLRIIDNKAYVTDIQSNSVYVVSMEGKLLQKIGEPGDLEGQLLAPNAVTVDEDGNIYVVDTGNQRVQVFGKDGKYKRMFNGSQGGESVFVNPRGIGIDSTGVVYVVSNLTHTVYGFDEKGKQVFQFGSMGEANGQFSLPNGLFIDNNDNVFVTDTLNQRVSVFK